MPQLAMSCFQGALRWMLKLRNPCLWWGVLVLILIHAKNDKKMNEFI